MTRLFAFASLLLIPAAIPAAGRPARHAAITDWTTVAAVTPEGGVRIGNPRARAQLVEYGSFTCPHCAAFAKEAFPAIRDRYVRTGRVSFEFRVALRDRADLAAAIVASCAGPQRFLSTALDVFARQGDWEQRAIDHDQQSPPAPDAPAGPALRELAQASGIAAIGVAHGLSPAQLNACYADAGLRAALSAAANDAWNVRQIGATPTFFLNGDKLDQVYGWTALEPNLRAALKS